jgi:hypothetical protein
MLIPRGCDLHHPCSFCSCIGLEHPSVNSCIIFISAEIDFKYSDSCLYTGEEDEFIGVALDGYPIYGPYVSDSDHILTSADLDECHSHVHLHP